jgi:hypothetical protein
MIQKNCIISFKNVNAKAYSFASSNRTYYAKLIVKAYLINASTLYSLEYLYARNIKLS